MGEFKAPSKVILSKKEMEKLDLEYNFYINKVQSCFALLHVFEEIQK
jgi:hypothetical protein